MILGGRSAGLVSRPGSVSAIEVQAEAWLNSIGVMSTNCAHTAAGPRQPTAQAPTIDRSPAPHWWDKFLSASIAVWPSKHTAEGSDEPLAIASCGRAPKKNAATIRNMENKMRVIGPGIWGKQR